MSDDTPKLPPGLQKFMEDSMAAMAITLSHPGVSMKKIVIRLATYPEGTMHIELSRPAPKAKRA